MNKPQCKWGARMLRGNEMLPGYYCCALREGHEPESQHEIAPDCADAAAVVVSWEELKPTFLHGRETTSVAAPAGRKDDSGKLRYDLVDPYALAWLVASLTYGVIKYEAWNWFLVENWRDRYYAALKRHLESWRAGEDDDDESGLPHLANAMFCVMCLTAKSAPRDMKIVVSRTKEAIRRWRESQVQPTAPTAPAATTSQPFKCDHHSDKGRCTQLAEFCCTCRRCAGNDADSFHSCAEHTGSQDIAARHRKIYPAHELILARITQ